MIRTFLFYFLLWLSLMASSILWIPLLLMPASLMGKIRRKYIWFFTSWWAGKVLYLAGIKLKVEGKMNIPEESRFVVVSNHQGNMDIPVYMSIFPYPLSFIAKKELLYFPFINIWLLLLNCIPINRKKPFRAKRKIERAMKEKRHNPLVLFPEGTRSRGKSMGAFKSLGLKAAYDLKISILPVNIHNSYQAWEAEKKIRPAEISVTIHPALTAELYSSMDFRGFSEAVRDIIEG